eukprot:1623965-Rhodomonas_salina.1
MPSLCDVRYWHTYSLHCPTLIRYAMSSTGLSCMRGPVLLTKAVPTRCAAEAADIAEELEQLKIEAMRRGGGGGRGGGGRRD